MIKKDRLLSQIEQLINTEKSLIPLLNKHVTTSLFFSNLKDDEREKIIEYFQNLVISKTKHIEILEGIKSDVAGRERNVY